MMTAADLRELQAAAAQLQAQLPTAVASAVAPVSVTTVEPGYTTTEWWSTLAVHLLAFAAVFHPGFTAPPDIVRAAVGIGAGVSQAAYTIGRSLRKSTK